MIYEQWELVDFSKTSDDLTISTTMVKLNDWAEPMHKPTQELEPIEHHHPRRKLDPA